MFKSMTSLRNLFILISFSFLSVTTLHAEPPNLSLIKNEVKQYHDSGRYEHDLSQKIKQAQQYIIEQARINEQQKKQLKLALVLDIDETSLSNYPSMAAHDFTSNQEQFHQHILDADAPPIKPTLALYNEALKHHIKIFFVTGRRESERAATKLNLIKAGYAHWAGLLLRPDAYSGTSIIPFKSQARAMITKKGYTIIASIGDQYSDIQGGYTLKGFKLPNPYYYLP